MNTEKQNILWECTGTQENSHPKVENNTHQCLLCSSTYDSKKIKINNTISKTLFNQTPFRYLSVASIGGFLAILLILSGLYLRMVDFFISEKPIQPKQCVQLLSKINNLLIKGANNVSKDEIKYLQNELKKTGYYHGKIDGEFGSLTLDATKKFQLHCNRF